MVKSMLRKILLFFLVILLLFGGGIIFSLWKGIREINDFVINEVDLIELTDGVYRGSTTAGPMNATVEVTVKDAKITKIDIVKHGNGRGEGAEAIVDMIISAQSLQVDTIAGATYSSKVILKAVERALHAK